MITENTQLPEKMDKFWPLSDNKVKMQHFSKSCLLYLAKRLNRPLIVSGTVDGEWYYIFITWRIAFYRDHLENGVLWR